MNGIGGFLRGLQSMALDMTQLVSDAASGEAAPEVSQARIDLCRTCQEADSNGERLPRMVDLPQFGPTAFCGAPRWSGMERDNVADGCGCCLKLKCRCAGAECPRGKW